MLATGYDPEKVLWLWRSLHTKREAPLLKDRMDKLDIGERMGKQKKDRFDQ